VELVRVVALTEEVCSDRMTRRRRRRPEVQLATMHEACGATLTSSSPTCSKMAIDDDVNKLGKYGYWHKNVVHFKG
jgi:hypothetical protein